MFSRFHKLYYTLKWNRLLYLMWEFILWYFIWLYIFHIHFDLWYFIYISIIYLALFGLVYPIVYIFNDICDVDKDKLNAERLKYKPLAAWKISLNDFLAYWIIWIWLGLIIASFAPAVFMLFFGFAILFNFFYTKYLKHMFIIENFANGITHSFVRLLLGIILAIYSLWKICISYYHFSFFHLINIIIPKDITINYWKNIKKTIFWKILTCTDETIIDVKLDDRIDNLRTIWVWKLFEFGNYLSLEKIKNYKKNNWNKKIYFTINWKI